MAKEILLFYPPDNRYICLVCMLPVMPNAPRCFLYTYSSFWGNRADNCSMGVNSKSNWSRWCCVNVDTLHLDDMYDCPSGRLSLFRRMLIRVDFPAPFAPTIAIRESMSTPKFNSVKSTFNYYWKLCSACSKKSRLRFLIRGVEFFLVLGIQILFDLRSLLFQSSPSCQVSLFCIVPWRPWQHSP